MVQPGEPQHAATHNRPRPTTHWCKRARYILSWCPVRLTPKHVLSHGHVSSPPSVRGGIGGTDGHSNDGRGNSVQVPAVTVSPRSPPLVVSGPGKSAPACATRFPPELPRPCSSASWDTATISGLPCRKPQIGHNKLHGHTSGIQAPIMQHVDVVPAWALSRGTQRTARVGPRPQALPGRACGRVRRSASSCILLTHPSTGRQRRMSQKKK